MKGTSTKAEGGAGFRRVPDNKGERGLRKSLVAHKYDCFRVMKYVQELLGQVREDSRSLSGTEVRHFRVF